MPGGDWKQLLRSKGLRITPQRELVYSAVADLRHATPDEILAHVQQQADGVNLSTVYRTLDVLEDAGLVGHAHLGHGSASYHPAGHRDHVHLVCQRCGSVEHAPIALAEAFAGTVQESTGFSVDMEHLAVHGLCRSCQASE